MPREKQKQWTTSGAEMNELQQMNFGKTPLDPLNLLYGLFLVCQGRVQCCGHSVVWSSGFGPCALLCQCIRFQMGLTLALDVPCWGPLKPETLEVDVCLCPVCSKKPFQIPGLQMWPSAWRHFGHSLVGWLRPCPRRLGPGHTTATSTMLTTSSLLQTREQTTLGWSATPAYTCHKT